MNNNNQVICYNNIIDQNFVPEPNDPPFITNEKLLLAYCKKNNIPYQIYENELSLYQDIINTLTPAHFNINGNLNKIYASFLANKMYIHKTKTVYAASSLQHIAPRICNEDNNTDIYEENPLLHSLIKSCSELESPYLFAFKNFTLPIKSIFFFNKIYDGPNAKDVWLIGCKHDRRDRSSIIVADINSNGNNTSLMPSQHFNGIIKNLVLHRNANRAYFSIELKNEKYLYEMIFSLKKQEATYNFYLLKQRLGDFKKLYILSDRLLIALATHNELYKINLEEKEISSISILDYRKQEIPLSNIIQNASLPYLWLLLSITNELYFLNLKDKTEKIYFTKILDLPPSDNIWFDKDHILVKHTNVTLPLTNPQPSTVPIQYSLYKLYILLSKANALKLSLDNNNTK